MAYGMQYIPRETVKVAEVEVLPDAKLNGAVWAAIDLVKYNRENRTIAYIALDAQYGSIEDAVILTEDTFLGSKVQLLDIIEEIHDIGERWSDVEGMTLKEFQRQDY